MTPKVLLVDDNADVRNLLRLTLSFDDYELREADSGVSALEIIYDWHPDIVLLDIMMPGEKDGLQVCREVKQDPALKDVFIAILTARGQKKDIENGESAGADSYLTKPFSPMDLAEKVKGFLSARK